MIETHATTITNDLIQDIADLNMRLVNIIKDAEQTDDRDLLRTMQRSFERLEVKRKNMLVQLRDVINNEIGFEDE